MEGVLIESLGNKEACEPSGRQRGAPRLTLQELKRQVKETWAAAKNLADAKRDELAALIERGDAELFKEYRDGCQLSCRLGCHFKKPKVQWAHVRSALLHHTWHPQSPDADRQGARDDPARSPGP